MFLLTEEELGGLIDIRSQDATSSGHGGRRYLPYAFTEYGVLQAAVERSSRTHQTVTCTATDECRRFPSYRSAKRKNRVTIKKEIFVCLD